MSLPSNGRFALRDRALLTFLYNTGARVQETADLCLGNLELQPPLRVHLHGKGDKWRVCPLWEKTAELLRRLIGTQKVVAADQPVFVSQRGQALTRYGTYKIVRHYAQDLKPKGQPHSQNISPHSMRHAAAMNLLESGVDINVIRGWLGHVSLETTNRYAEINIRMKEAALQRCEPGFGDEETYRETGKWHSDQTLLEWLEQL